MSSPNEWTKCTFPLHKLLFIYGLQPQSAGVGRKISVVIKRHWHCATFFTFSKKPVNVMIYLGKSKTKC